MYEAQFLIFCAGKSADNRGNISLHGIFDRLYLTDFPGRHTPFLAVAQIMAKKAVIDKQLNIRIVTELDSKEVGSQLLQISVTVEKDFGFGFDIDFGGFVFPEAGKYYIKIYIDDSLLITRKLDVRSTDELTEQ